jgi:parvulin-like peptidyl-prolyl isomerase
MKIRFAVSFIAALCAFVFIAPSFTGCSTPPPARVVQVQSLKAVGQSAEAAVTLTANLYAAHQITGTQARQVMDFYDQKFQPAFRVAVAAVNANMDSIASPDLQGLANQLSNLVATFANKPTP